MKVILADPNTVKYLFDFNLIKQIFSKATLQVFVCPRLLTKLNNVERATMGGYIQQNKLQQINLDTQILLDTYNRFRGIDCCERNSVYFAEMNPGYIIVSNEKPIHRICKDNNIPYEKGDFFM